MMLNSINIPIDIKVGINNTIRIDKECKGITNERIMCPLLMWISDNPSIAIVDIEGKVTGIAIGTINIRATDITGTIISNNCSVTVITGQDITRGEIGSITLIPNIKVVVNNDVRIFRICQTQSGEIVECYNLTWTSDNSSIATVNTDGEVTGISVGTANVTASYTNSTGTIITSNNCAVSVISVATGELGTITIIPNMVILVNNTFKLPIKCKDTSGEGIRCPTLNWVSDNPTILTVDVDGIITGVSAGTANVTASTQSITSNRCNVTVITDGIGLPLSSITIPDTKTIGINRPRIIFSQCKDSSGNRLLCPALNWTSSDINTVTVDNCGIVIGIAVGNANITVVDPITGITSNLCNIIVTAGTDCDQEQVGDIELGRESDINIPRNVIVKSNRTTKVIPLDKLGNMLNCRYMTWTSSDESVAKVDQNGNVTGLKPGVATIYTYFGSRPGYPSSRRSPSTSPTGSLVSNVSTVVVLQGAGGITDIWNGTTYGISNKLLIGAGAVSVLVVVTMMGKK